MRLLWVQSTQDDLARGALPPSSLRKTHLISFQHPPSPAMISSILYNPDQNASKDALNPEDDHLYRGTSRDHHHPYDCSRLSQSSGSIPPAAVPSRCSKPSNATLSPTTAPHAHWEMVATSSNSSRPIHCTTHASNSPCRRRPGSSTGLINWYGYCD